MYYLEICRESDLEEVNLLPSEITWGDSELFAAYRTQFCYISRCVKTEKIGAFVCVYSDHGDDTFYISNIGADWDCYAEALAPILHFITRKLTRDYNRENVEVIVNEYNEALHKALKAAGFKCLGIEDEHNLIPDIAHYKFAYYVPAKEALCQTLKNA